MAHGDETTRRERRGKKTKHRKDVQAQKGDKYVDGNEYVPQAMHEEQDALNERLRKAVKYTKQLPSVPMDCQPDTVQQIQPHIHHRIIEGRPMHLNKAEPQLARIIWYNELDDRHTFNRRNKVSFISFLYTVI